MEETLANNSNITINAMPEVLEMPTAPEPVLMDVSLSDTEKQAFETNQLDLDAEIEKGREKKEETTNPEEILKKELTKEEQTNIINSEIRDISAKIAQLDSVNQETISNINNIRAKFGITTPLNFTVESTTTNTQKILELSKTMETLIEKKNKLVENGSVPGMAEVVKEFKPEEHQN